MAISGMTMAAEALRVEYLDMLRVQFNEQADPILAQIEQSTRQIHAGEIKMALRYGRNGGVGALATDLSDLPDTNSRKTLQVTFGTKNLSARIMLSDKLIKTTRSDVAAFANMLETEIEDAKKDAVDDLSRQIYGDGTGKLATCTAQTDVNDLVLSDVKFLAEGMYIDIYATNNTVKVSKREITNVNETTNTITISGAVVTTLATDYIVRNGNYGAEITGLGAVFTADSTLYGKDRSSYSWMNPKAFALNGEIDEVKIQEAIDWADDRGAKVNYISTSKGVARAWHNYQLEYKRNQNFLDLKGGFRAMAYVTPAGELALMGTKYAPKSKMRLLDLNHWFLPQLADWEWLGEDGAMLSRVSGKAAYEATLLKYCDLVTDMPGAAVEITGITEH